MSSTTVSKDAINYNTNYIKTARYFFIQLESTTESSMKPKEDPLPLFLKNHQSLDKILLFATKRID